MLSRLTSQWSRVPHSPLLTYGVAVGASLLALGLGTLSEAWINGQRAEQKNALFIHRYGRGRARV